MFDHSQETKAMLRSVCEADDEGSEAKLTADIGAPE